jgi:glycosyltransferase involved in cell wall biosynthesis
VPHPQSGTVFPTEPRAGDPTQIVLLGAIGPHKGSGRLLELAKLARLAHPQLHFHVVGYTDVDEQLARLANVTVTGRYTAAELPEMLAETRGSIALFLHEWPETFSYTLTEAVAAGLVPVVPDIGAPAERVREAGFGIVYPVPIDFRQLLETLDQVAKGRMKVAAKGSGPGSYCTADAAKVISRLVGMASPAASAPAPNRTKNRKVARTVRARTP